MQLHSRVEICPRSNSVASACSPAEGVWMHNLEVMGVLPKLKGSNDKMVFKDMSKFSNERTNEKK